jgi:hypothetical protein
MVDTPSNIYDLSIQTSTYPLVNVNNKLWKITMLYSWVNPLFRLGHFPVLKLFVYQGATRIMGYLMGFNDMLRGFNGI